MGAKVIKATIICHNEKSLQRGSTGYPLNEKGQRSDVNIHFDSYRGVNQDNRLIFGFIYKGLPLGPLD